MSEFYSAELVEVIDGDTFYLRVYYPDSSQAVIKFRLIDIRTENISKTKGTTLEGGLGLNYKYLSKQWFYENNPALNIEFITKDIVGRWLGIIKALGNDESLNVYLLSKFKRDDYWSDSNQQEEKQKWFSGETVIVKDGGELPEFVIWGKQTNKAGRSNQTGRM